MEVARLEPSSYAEWDRLCDASDDGWFWQTRSWQEYTVGYRPNLATRNEAFLILDNGRVVGGVPAMVEQSDLGGVEIAAGGGPCWSPLIAPDLDYGRYVEVLRLALAEVDRLARETNAVRSAVRWSPLAPRFTLGLGHWLAETTRAGYSDIGMTSVVVDLTMPEERLWGAIRKGHRADIRRGQRSVSVTVHDSGTITDAAFTVYRELHARAAGRATRPGRTFDLMRDWISNDRGALLTASVEGAAIGCTYLILYKDGAYYASAANDPDASDLPVGHVLQWEAIRWLHEHGYRQYEIGIQQFGPLLHDNPSPKEIAISHFKRGFGGTLAPTIAREKFYEVDVAVQTWAGRAAAWAAVKGQSTDAPQNGGHPV